MRRTQFTSLRDYTAISCITIQETGDSKKQWPPVGKSSDTPKEVKNARREELPTGNREAPGYGAGCVSKHKLYPDNICKLNVRFIPIFVGGFFELLVRTWTSPDEWANIYYMFIQG